MKIFQNKYILYITLLFLGVVSISSFDQREDKELVEVVKETIPPLVQKELEKKLLKYQQIILDRCRNEAIEDAEIYIDSLVAEELKFQARDTLKFPAKPRRPDLREPIILNDTTAIAPIVNDTQPVAPVTNDTTTIIPAINDSTDITRLIKDSTAIAPIVNDSI